MMVSGNAIVRMVIGDIMDVREVRERTIMSDFFP